MFFEVDASMGTLCLVYEGLMLAWVHYVWYMRG